MAVSRYALLVISVLLASNLFGQTADLANIISNPDNFEASQKLPQVAFDAGPPAIGYLESVLKSGSAEQQMFADAALVYVGGPAALDVLSKRNESAADVTTKTNLCIALASRGNSTDVEFLKASLRGKSIGDEWEPIAAAALSLGVLRSSDSIDALHTVADREDGSIASGHASAAIRWIRQGRWRVSMHSDATEKDKIFAAVLANGMRWTHDADTVKREADVGFWRLRNGLWTLRPNGHLDHVSISYSVHVSPDGRRALVSVAQVLGPLDGSGYTYLLREELGAWKVFGVVFSWIS